MALRGVWYTADSRSIWAAGVMGEWPGYCNESHVEIQFKTTVAIILLPPDEHG